MKFSNFIVKSQMNHNFAFGIEVNSCVIEITIGKDNAYPTLEPQLVKANGLAKMNKILGCNYSNETELIKYMKAHKGDCALAVFEEGEGVNMPTYILDAIQ